MKKALGIYIHVPFCLKKCNYCDFCSFAGVDDDVKAKYVDALCRHIRLYRDTCSCHTVDSIYFGGGTPTLLPIDLFEKIFAALCESFDVSESAEITVECNPKTADVTYFKALHKMGVNRLSLGVQSANDNELRALGRVHTWGDSVDAFFDARRAGFENISADIMFGIPEQTEKSLENTLERVTELSPTHISAYGLIIEPGTPFFVNYEKLVLPDEDSEYNMYTGTRRWLSQHGFVQYEISNFALPGKESFHNLKYWRREEYLGFGVSAHSFFDETRFACPSSLNEYICGNYTGERSRISPNDAASEFVMLGMRLTEGVSESEFRSRFGKGFEESYGDALDRFVKSGFVVRKGGRCAFTDSGFYVSNTVLSEILSFDSSDDT